MKYSISLLMVLLFIPISIDGSIKLGVLTGINLSGFVHSDHLINPTLEQIPDLMLGIDFNLVSRRRNTPNQIWLFRTGLRFLKQTNTFQTPAAGEYFEIQQRVSMSSLQIPVIVECHPSLIKKVSVGLYSGMYLGYVLSVKNRLDHDEDYQQFNGVSVDQDLFEYGLSFGIRLGHRMGRGQIQLDFGYMLSLNDIRHHLLLWDHHRTRGFTLSIGYQFF
jgi:hypothetical protein